MTYKKILIGNDHGGYNLKLTLVEYLKSESYEVVDFGSHGGEIVRYPYYAAQVASAISTSIAQRGILICSTGIGMSIIANKYKNVRASLCYSTYQARMTRAHNNSNILCLGGRCIGDLEAIDMLQLWLNTEYEGGRHDISLGLIADCEAHQLADDVWKPDVPDVQ
jgi:ribose 5-phosphate isomerase B